MYNCFEMCIPPDFCGFRMKTWSRLKWSSWDSLWPEIWPWLSSKRARWKPEYQHFVLYIKLKYKTMLFDKKTLNQTCSERIYSCSCSEHITSSSMYRPDTPKNQHVTSLSNNKYMTYYVHYTLSEDWYRKTTHTPTMTRLPDFPFFYQLSHFTFSSFSKTITLDSWTKYTDHQKKLQHFLQPLIIF